MPVRGLGIDSYHSHHPTRATGDESDPIRLECVTSSFYLSKVFIPTDTTYNISWRECASLFLRTFQVSHTDFLCRPISPPSLDVHFPKVSLSHTDILACPKLPLCRFILARSLHTDLSRRQISLDKPWQKCTLFMSSYLSNVYTIGTYHEVQYLLRRMCLVVLLPFHRLLRCPT
jgi:hypothetical protein